MPRIRIRSTSGTRPSVGGGIICILASFLLAFGTYQLMTSRLQTAYTQAHGVRERATITNVDHEQDCNSGSDDDGCSYSTNLTVTLPVPVHGHTSTVVYIPHQATYANGQPVTVLVDGEKPGYAELPGDPGYPVNYYFMILAPLFTLFVLGLGISLIVRARRYRPAY